MWYKSFQVQKTSAELVIFVFGWHLWLCWGWGRADCSSCWLKLVHRLGFSRIGQTVQCLNAESPAPAAEVWTTSICSSSSISSILGHASISDVQFHDSICYFLLSEYPEVRTHTFVHPLIHCIWDSRLLKQFTVLQSCSRHHTAAAGGAMEKPAQHRPSSPDWSHRVWIPAWRSTKMKELLSRVMLGNSKCNTWKNLHSDNVPELPLIFSSSESILLQSINPHCIRKVIISYGLGAKESNITVNYKALEKLEIRSTVWLVLVFDQRELKTLGRLWKPEEILEFSLLQSIREAGWVSHSTSFVWCI